MDLEKIWIIESSVERLKCYQCEVREAKLCTDEYLLPCPDNQAYDTCLTRIRKTKDDGVWIHKNCALAPCSLRDTSQSSGLGLDHCDRSQDEYDCVSCCKENGCNTGGGTACQPTIVSIIALILLASFFGIRQNR
ncbi:uncharacterized protein TNCT_551681 [Trichonephila clavata]|uniref:Uncharacterized protein n=1 Tax=Trichonephila clavata TaxID=2740835 RepID=A0A8X6JPF9_TRICU|nr:uncharacterized protein TNCT_551681 [Trichonephila clavata]